MQKYDEFIYVEMSARIELLNYRSSLNKNSGTTTFNGNVIVGGDFTSSNSALIIGTGSISIAGTTVINSTFTIFGSSTGSTDSTYGPGGALPIELLSFDANQCSETEINWETLTELNNDFFTL
ncbi:hypothetical protein N9502_00610 [Vicingaceae bacterium]|nr:hypothetical protein [Vicingaceae bacterium]